MTKTLGVLISALRSGIANSVRIWAQERVDEIRSYWTESVKLQNERRLIISY